MYFCWWLTAGHERVRFRPEGRTRRHGEALHSPLGGRLVIDLAKVNCRLPSSRLPVHSPNCYVQQFSPDDSHTLADFIV